MSKTAAHVAEPISGNRLYQERARHALPILVRQAEAGKCIFYSDLAEELEMPNPRNLDYVLGSIGRTMENLTNRLKERIPPIQCLVVNKRTHLPGEGVGWFLIKKEEFASLPAARKQAIVQAELGHIYAFPRWRSILNLLDLGPLSQSFTDINKAAAAIRGGGESEHHRTLKEFIANHPDVVGLPKSTPHGRPEIPLPSGDRLDISFSTKRGWVAVEVKSHVSSDADIARGLYQCVKYVAVMRAVEASENRQIGARALLALGRSLPDDLIPLRNMLGVTVIENISIR